VDFSESDESEDEVRVVKSAKERFVETSNAHIKVIRAAMKSRDYKLIQSEFDDLSKAMVKAKKVLAAGVPRPLVRILCDLEDYVSVRLADKTAFKKLSAAQGRALNRMKLTLKKHNKPYQKVMELYRKNPIVDEEEEEEEEEEGEKASAASEESSSEESSESESSESSSSESEEEKSVSLKQLSLLVVATMMTISPPRISRAWLNSSFPMSPLAVALGNSIAVKAIDPGSHCGCMRPILKDESYF
jgi:translation initiation factor 3 subunit C